MNPLYGPLTADQRDTLSATGDMLALLPVPGCRDLSTRLGCIAATRRPTPAQVRDTITLAQNVQRALTIEAAPDRWLDDVSGYDPDLQNEIVADLIDQRRAQSQQVGQALAVLRTVPDHANTEADVLA